MQSLTVLLDTSKTYGVNIKLLNGLFSYLVRNNLLKNIKDVKVDEIDNVKLNTTQKKIYVQNRIGNQTYDYQNEKQLFIIVTTNRIKNKNMPKNVKLICSQLAIEQETGPEKGIVKVDVDNYSFVTVNTIIYGLIKLKLLNDNNTVANWLTDSVFATACGLGHKLKQECVLELLTYLGVALELGTQNEYNLISDTINRLSKLSNYEKLEDDLSAYIVLNEAVRGQKMNQDNSLSYSGFKFFSSLFDSYNAEDIRVYEKNKLLSNLKSFLIGYLSVIMLDELGYFVKIPSKSEKYFKLLICEDNKYNKNIDIVLPHLHRYVGFISFSKPESYLDTSVYLFREHKNQRLLDLIMSDKRINSKEKIILNLITDNDKFVENKVI